MKKYIFLPLTLLFLTACGEFGNKPNQQQVEQKPVFNPNKQTETVVTKSPAAKPDDPMAFVGRVKLNIMIPEGLNENDESLLKHKMMNMTALNGVGSVDASPLMCIIPTFAELSRDITATVPVKHQVKYDFNIFVANLETGEVFASSQQELLGIGDSDQLAMTNAISSIKPNDDRWQQMLKIAQDRIIEYYNANGDRILKEAQGYLAVNKYATAMTIVNNIPLACGELYDQALDLKNVILDTYFQNDASQIIAEMMAALASPRDDENGFSSEFIALYTMIPVNSKAKSVADSLYNEYVKGLDETAAKNAAIAQQEWEAEQKIREINAKNAPEMQKNSNEFQLAMYKEEMAAKIAVEGNQALLEKYKKDANYNKLGRIWKLFYIGRE